ncbi:unnamed protein product [Kluyveromyces dobzhanskii CBS 2104]|uniref:WGS project CCBQ000000000 data, contig 00058 n=1 Tax=Kluyveromyces dobzhanskii CBS 2104 TaxID=1427455 RepID=A0A0A8LDZ1_9SACH|nr:unnamed protein product [Kluyveromyces dobzhanskii CBS 2104]
MTTVEVKRVLTTLLRDPENNRCGDCKTATHPRWASWSLGVFICIKCAGFHRSMGTHISKVKSVDLDSWEEEHLASVLKYGNNKKFNEFYENSLGGGSYVPDQSKLGQFIKTKYDLKKWVGENPVVETAPHTRNLTENKDSAAHKGPLQTSSSTTSEQCSTSDIHADIIPKVNTKSTSQMSSQNPITARSDICKPPDRPDLKKSILSLYANRKSGSPQSQSQSQSPSPSSLHLPNRNFGSVNNSLNGGGISSNPWAVPQAADDSRSGSSLSLDDDLFKNVWS